MGSQPWTRDCISRLLASSKYRANKPFTIRRGRRRLTGTIECGHEGTLALIFVGNGVMTLDQKTVIDGVPAPDWRETEPQA